MATVPNTPPSSHPPRLHTDLFIAELRVLSRLQHPPPIPSLTWHCRAMSDFLTPAPDVLALLQPISPPTPKPPTPELPLPPPPYTHPPPSDPLLADLTSRLARAERLVETARREARMHESLIRDLKSQLQASTKACKELVDTVMEQENAIQRLI